MNSIVPRLQVFEIDDQSWFPSPLRSRVQAILTSLWTAWIPFLQRMSPASQAAQILHRVMGEDIPKYTIVDFCSGAGGPTPFIEETLNQQLQRTRVAHIPILAQDDPPNNTVDFVLTDIAPHTSAWRAASANRPNLFFVPKAVDATNAPSDLLISIGLRQKRILRTFHLSFHHFSDAIAIEILRNTFETADGIAIMELIERSFASLLMETLMLVPIMFMTIFSYWHDPLMLIFTYLIPIVPFVVVFDGYMSSLRTRTPEEVMNLVKKADSGSDWIWTWGREQHTWPVGYTTYIIGRRP